MCRAAARRTSLAPGGLGYEPPGEERCHTVITQRSRKRFAAAIALLTAVTLGTLGSSGIAGAAQSASPLGRSAVAPSGIGLPGGLNNSGGGVLKSALYFGRALKSKLSSIRIQTRPRAA